MYFPGKKYGVDTSYAAIHIGFIKDLEVAIVLLDGFFYVGAFFKPFIIDPMRKEIVYHIGVIHDFRDDSQGFVTWLFKFKQVEGIILDGPNVNGAFVAR